MKKNTDPLIEQTETRPLETLGFILIEIREPLFYYLFDQEHDTSRRSSIKQVKKERHRDYKEKVYRMKSTLEKLKNF